MKQRKEVVIETSVYISDRPRKLAVLRIAKIFLQHRWLIFELTKEVVAKYKQMMFAKNRR
jgi:hypothetical protein